MIRVPSRTKGFDPGAASSFPLLGRFNELKPVRLGFRLFYCPTNFIDGTLTEYLPLIISNYVAIFLGRRIIYPPHLVVPLLPIRPMALVQQRKLALAEARRWERLIEDSARIPGK